MENYCIEYLDEQHVHEGLPVEHASVRELHIHLRKLEHLFVGQFSPFEFVWTWFGRSSKQQEPLSDDYFTTKKLG